MRLWKILRFWVTRLFEYTLTPIPIYAFQYAGRDYLFSHISLHRSCYVLRPHRSLSVFNCLLMYSI